MSRSPVAWSPVVAAALLLAAPVLGCPAASSAGPASAPTAGAPVLPPAVLGAPDWTLLLRPGDLLAASAIRTLLGGLGLAGQVEDFVQRSGFDLARIGWVRVDRAAGRSVFVLPASEADKLAAALSSPLPGPALPGEGPESPDASRARSDRAGNWGIVHRTPDPAAAPLAPQAVDPVAAELARLLRRVEGATLVFWVRGPFDVRPELDPAGLLGATSSLGCAAAPLPSGTLRFGCVLFGVRGDNLSTATLQTLVAKVFDSTLGMILDLQGAAESLRFDPEPAAPYVEAELKVDKLLPGLRVIASVPLAHVLEGHPPAPAP